jgi:hypothetical protein
MTRLPDAVLNLLTVTVAVTAGVVLVNDRVRPMLAERARLDPGDAIEDPVLVRRIVPHDTVNLVGAEPKLLVVFQSTCDVCERVSPSWQDLAAANHTRPMALGLDADSVSIDWLSKHLPAAEAVAAVDLSGLLDRFRIRAVPTTILLAEGRLQLSRLGPLRSDDIVRINRAFSGSPAAAPIP